jgi:hypothetical protein
LKSWIAKLRQHVSEWEQALPKDLAHFVYRFDEINNVVKILNAGQLLSRAECARRDIQYMDCASSTVIANTVAAHKDFVRLYFYPRTPTQYHNEGIRPRQCYSKQGAHCAVPVFMLFDFVTLLADDLTQFSTGNMAAANVEFGTSDSLFEKIPFDLVYHRGSTWGHQNAGAIVFHRHAEVLVPVSLSTEGIKRIVCRSHPERRTLLYRLRPDLRARFENLVRVEASDFFERGWAFVESVEPGTGFLKFTFHPPDSFSSPLLVTFRYEDGTRVWNWEKKWQVRSPLSMDLSKAGPAGVATLLIEGSLAFQDKVSLTDTPL